MQPQLQTPNPKRQTCVRGGAVGTCLAHAIHWRDAGDRTQMRWWALRFRSALDTEAARDPLHLRALDILQSLTSRARIRFTAAEVRELLETEFLHPGTQRILTRYAALLDRAERTRARHGLGLSTLIPQRSTSSAALSFSLG